MLETKCQELMKQYSDETQLIPKPESWYDVMLVVFTINLSLAQNAQLAKFFQKVGWSFFHHLTL